MAIRILASRGVAAARQATRPVAQRKLFLTSPVRKYYRCSPMLLNTADKQESHNPADGDPIADSMKESAAPSGGNAFAVSQAESDEAKNKNAAL